jgi:hypothetical protein
MGSPQAYAAKLFARTNFQEILSGCCMGATPMLWFASA